MTLLESHFTIVSCAVLLSGGIELDHCRQILTVQPFLALLVLVPSAIRIVIYVVLLFISTHFSLLKNHGSSEQIDDEWCGQAIQSRNG